jgi:hypothetical protein
MTERSVTNPRPAPQPSTPTAFELSWDDALDGNFPPTRQQRLQQAAVAVAEQLQEQADLPVTQDRLTKALDLVLSNAVILHPDGTASVRSGSRSYTVANGGCSCADAKQRGVCCKHQLAVEIRRRAAALLQEAPAAAAGQPEAAAAVPSTPASARWDVHEAPTSACFKFRVHTMELTYTFRGVDDAELQARIAETLPMLQTMMEACEDRHAVRQAEREAAKASQAQPGPLQASTPADLQQLVQQPYSTRLRHRAAARLRPLPLARHQRPRQHHLSRSRRWTHRKDTVPSSRCGWSSGTMTAAPGTATSPRTMTASTSARAKAARAVTAASATPRQGQRLCLPPWGGHMMTYGRKAFGPQRRTSRQALARDIAASILAARQRGEQRLITNYTQHEELIRLVEEQLSAAARDRQLAQEGETYPVTDVEHDLF